MMPDDIPTDQERLLVEDIKQIAESLRMVLQQEAGDVETKLYALGVVAGDCISLAGAETRTERARGFFEFMIASLGVPLQVETVS
jgi:hypothetical protein